MCNHTPGGLPAPPASAASLLSLAESSRPPTLAANAARASKAGHAAAAARAPRFDYLRKLSAAKPPQPVPEDAFDDEPLTSSTMTMGLVV